jgi:ABC-type Fe3+/spermidine/putrescine transport system ATPase subunit
MSDTIIVLSGGRIEQIGAPDDVYHSPRSLFVARFLGESNVISGTARTDGHSWWIECVNLPPLRAQNPVSVTPIAKAALLW